MHERGEAEMSGSPDRITGSGMLRDRVVLITGAASAIGAAIARAAIREGARVALADRDLDSAGA